jgi:mitogen-activated protein kinase kinase kinase 9
VIEHADYNDKADVYSYGIILWELCARETPYSDMDDEYKIAEAVLLRDYRPAIPSYVPPGMRPLFLLDVVVCVY